MKLIIIIMFLLLSALSSLFSLQNPTWLDSLKSEYPAETYITAIGSAPDAFHAQNNAIVNLVIILNSGKLPDIANQNRYAALMTKIEKKAAESNKKELIIHDPPVKDFLDVVCEKEWTDKEGNRNAFAYLHRQKATEYIKQNVNETSNFIRKFTEQAMLSSHTWMIYSCYNAANVISLMNEELLSQLAVISPDARDAISMGYNPEEIKKKKAEWAKAIKFSVEVFGETGDEDFIQSEISNIIKSNGWETSDVNAALLEAHIYLNESEQKETEKEFNYTYSISAYSLDGNLMFNMSSKPGMGKPQSDALKNMTDKISTELPEKLYNYFADLAAGHITKE